MIDRSPWSRVASFAAALLACGAAQAVRPPAWTPIGPPGGAAASIAADPSRASRVAVLSAGSTLAVSEDAGQSWTMHPSPCGAGFADVGSLEFHRGALHVACGRGVFRSIDSGATWVELTPAGGSAARGVLFSPPDPSIMLAIEPETEQFTLDGGRTWRWLGIGTGTLALAMHVSQRDAAFALQRASGQHPVQLHKLSPLGSASVVVSDLVAAAEHTAECGRAALAQDADGTLYAAAFCRLLVSSDQGLSWRAAGSLGPGGFDVGVLTRLRADPGRAGHAIALGTTALLETRDGGRTWARTPFPSTPGGGWLPDLAVGADGAAWVATRGEPHLLVARDGVLAPVAIPLRESGWLAPEAGRDARFRMAAAPGTDRIWRSSDGGATWTAGAIAGFVVHEILQVDAGPSAFYALTSPAEAGRATHVHLTLDGGATWQDTGAALATEDGLTVRALQPAGPQPGLIHAIAARRTYVGGGIFSHEAEAALTSRDGGRTWARIATDVAGTPRSLLASPSDTQRLYLATNGGLYRSTNGGAGWTLMSSSFFPPLELAAIDAADPDVLYAKSQERVWISEDGGTSWRKAPRLDFRHASSIAEIAVRSDPFDRDTVYAVDTAGIAFRSRDRGRTWRQLSLPHQAGEIHPAAVRVAASGVSRSLLAKSTRSLLELPVAAEPLVIDAGLWWNPSRSGTGLSIVQHASGQLFVVWFTYDASGKPLWQVVPGGRWVDERTFEGELYQTRAAAYFSGAFDPATVSIRRVGSARLAFADGERATFSYARTEGSSGTGEIERQRLGATWPAFIASIADLWWSPHESGAGLGVAHEGERLFLTWFAYDQAGNPTWLVGSDVKRDNMVNRFEGDLHATEGPPDGTPYDPAKVVVRKVGSAVLWRRGDTLSIDYEAFGSRGRRELSRQPF